MREQFTDALKTAMKKQDKRKTSTLRLILAAIKDRDIASRSEDRDGVSDSEILDILARMIKQRRESVVTYEEAGRLELAAQEQEEIDIISTFLPKQLDDDEIDAAVTATLKEIDAAGLKDMGRAMAALKDRYAGQMDFSKASAMVKSKLS